MPVNSTRHVHAGSRADEDTRDARRREPRRDIAPSVVDDRTGDRRDPDHQVRGCRRSLHRHPAEDRHRRNLEDPTAHAYRPLRTPGKRRDADESVNPPRLVRDLAVRGRVEVRALQPEPRPIVIAVRDARHLPLGAPRIIRYAIAMIVTPKIFMSVGPEECRRRSLPRSPRGRCRARASWRASRSPRRSACYSTPRRSRWR